MCYSYYEDFERRTKKDSARKPETHTTEETPVQPAGKRPPTEGTLWTFLARRRREFDVTEPTTERIREKV
ncbi:MULTISPECIES: hypothetical protein [unclassified Paenarthrobacter]|uniref:hypothetical protein n=1 Tax=unclassified Paenarthrobacter TaxID=2634190 RepID=UPI003CE7A95E